MVELTPYALRLPPAMKDAAKAMSKVSFHEWAEDGSRTVGGYTGNSMNDALNYLLRKGVAGAVHAMQHDIKEVSSEREFWQNIARYFLDNPDRDRATADQFDGEIKAAIQAWDEDQSDLYSEDDRALGFSRKKAMEELAWSQTRLTNFRDAEKALQAALA